MRAGGRWRGLAFVLMLSLTVSGCAAGEVTAGPTDAPTREPTPTPTGLCGHQSVSVDYGPRYIAGLYDHGTIDFGTADPNEDLAISTTTVVATVQTIEPGVVRRVYGTVEAVTPIDIEVEAAIDGNATRGGTRVFVEGGTAGCYETTVDAAPHLDPGGRYLLFLVPPATSPAPDEPEWLKVIVAWAVDPDDTVHTVQGPMPLADLMAAIRRIAPAST